MDTFTNKINTFLDEIKKDYENELNTQKNNILTKISTKYNISINDLENCLNNIDENKEDLIGGELLEERRINKKKYYINTSQNKIFRKIKNKLEHVGHIEGNEYIFN